MKKKIYLLMLVVLIGVMSFAQQPTVQGISHSQVRNQAKASPTDVYPNIYFDDIEYWVGKGRKKAALVVKWDDGKGGNKNLVWGYMWNSDADGTGDAMLRAVAKEDPRFYMLVYKNNQSKSTIAGLGFDLDGNGNISLVKGGRFYDLNEGVCNTSYYDFDEWESCDSADHWRAGWTSGFWCCYVSRGLQKPYQYSGIADAGMISLQNGSILGMVYAADLNDWGNVNMTGEVEYVSYPDNTLSLNKVSRADEPADSKTYTVSSLRSLRETIENKANDGDIIEFAPGLRGTVIENDNPENGYEITKSLTIIGNGVIIGEGTGFFCYEQGKKLIFKDFVFRGVNNGAIYTNKCSLTVDGCKFENCNSEKEGAAIRFENTTPNNFVNLDVVRCVFSNNKSTISVDTGDGGAIYIKDFPSGKNNPFVTVKIVSCTFVGNEAAIGSAVYIVNYPDVRFTNNVFEGNKATEDGGVTIALSRGDQLPEGRVKSLGYNVIEGTITSTTENHLAESDVIGEELDPILQLDGEQYKVLSSGAAYNHLPANTVLEGITFPEYDASGVAIDYTKPTHSGACQLVYSTTQADYTKGTFILNEDWYGHQNSTINFLSEDGEWFYRVFQKENPGMELGCTAQYGAIYGDKFYIMAKQEKDPGASVVGGRLTVCDAKTMKVIKQIQIIHADDKGTSDADGRGFLGVDEHKAYLGTSNGIYVLDLDNLEITGSVAGTGNGTDEPFQDLYGGQIGSMVRVNDNVFAVHQKLGLLVIDAKTDLVKTTIEGPDEWGFGSIVLSKDGNLWLSLSSPSGSGQADTRIVKLDPTTLEQTIIDCPEGIFGPANSWYAWTPDGFCASTQNNVLYWNGGNGSWFSNKTVFKYDIDKNEFSTFIDLNSEDWKMYGCSFRLDPVTDEAYISLYKEFSDPTYVLRKYDNAGNILGEYTMITNYWFPSLPIFPDNEAPVVQTVDPVEILSAAEPTTVSLKDVATDADNMAAAMVKSVKSISDETVLAAEMQNGDLVITPLKDGEADITVQVNSNGKLAECVVSVKIEGTSSVGKIEAEDGKVVSRYTLDGKLLNARQRGINILRMSDGTIKKVIVK